MLAGPALVVAALRGRRAAVALLVLAPPSVEWWRRRPEVGPLRWLLASIADDLAYGAGVWTGCVRSRTLGPLLPTLRIRWRADQVRRLG
jgi:mycofactocin glycosyltransferase